MNSNYKIIIILAVFFSALYSDPGCTDATACNYDAAATEDNGTCNLPDCAGVCNGNLTGDSVLDNCGTCDDNPNNDCQQDCFGIWGLDFGFLGVGFWVVPGVTINI